MENRFDLFNKRFKADQEVCQWCRTSNILNMEKRTVFIEIVIKDKQLFHSMTFEESCKTPYHYHEFIEYKKKLIGVTVKLDPSTTMEAFIKNFIASLRKKHQIISYLVFDEIQKLPGAANASRSYTGIS